jgi:hypothetical protein
MQKRTIGRRLKVCISFIVLVVLPLFLGGCGSGNSSLPVFNVTGTWYMFHATSGTAGEEGPNLFTFTQTDNDLAGTTSQGELLSGTTSNLDISFSWRTADGTLYTYVGTVSANGFTMTGTWNNSIQQSGTWAGIYNTTPSVNISGTWNIFLSDLSQPGTTEQGPFPATFTQTDNAVSGTTTAGQQITGAVSRLSILFFESGSDGVTYTFIGSLNSAGNSMTGSWSATNGQSGAWRAEMIL